MTDADHPVPSPAGPRREPLIAGVEVKHLLHGKPLSECSIDELSREAIAGEEHAAMAEVFTVADEARLKALWAAYLAKPVAERVEFETRMEQEA